MKANEVNSIVSVIRQARTFETLIVSILVLPIFLGSWILILKQLNANLWNSSIIILTLLILMFFLGVFIMKYYQWREYKMEIARNCIMNFLLSKNWNRISFDLIRNKFNTKWDNKFLQNVIIKFNSDFTIAKIKGGKQGVKLIEIEQEQEEINQ
jgi:hypothetical protein